MEFINEKLLLVMDDDRIHFYTRGSVEYVTPPKTEAEKKADKKMKRQLWKAAKTKALVQEREHNNALSPRRLADVAQVALADATLKKAAESRATTPTPLSKPGTPVPPGGAALEGEKATPKYSEFLRTGQIDMEFRKQGKIPVLLRRILGEKLMIGFDDGSVQIVVCTNLTAPVADQTLALKELAAFEADLKAAEAEEAAEAAAAAAAAEAAAKEGRAVTRSHASSRRSSTRATTKRGRRKDRELIQHVLPAVCAIVACEFRGHFTGSVGSKSLRKSSGSASGSRSKRMGIIAAAACPWSLVSGGGEHGYRCELLTVGADERLSHWGVRYKVGRTAMKLKHHYISEFHRRLVHDHEVAQIKLREGRRPKSVAVEATAEDGSSVADTETLITIESAQSSHSGDYPMEVDLLGVRQTDRLIATVDR